ncbi:MAG: hypothetical protein ABIA92_00155 [Patescibacteria group bacterium]
MSGSQPPESVQKTAIDDGKLIAIVSIPRNPVSHIEQPLPKGLSSLERRKALIERQQKVVANDIAETLQKILATGVEQLGGGDVTHLVIIKGTESQIEEVKKLVGKSNVRANEVGRIEPCQSAGRG